MKRILFFVLTSVLTLSGCENTNSINKEVKTRNREKRDSIITTDPEPIVDSIDYDTTNVVIKESEKKDTSKEKEKRKEEDNSINIEEALDVNKFKSVRDDPDYIGTPCEYVNAECIRHYHKEPEKLPKESEEGL